MRAAVFHKPFDIKIQDLPKQTPGKNEALIRVKSASICGTDVEIFRGESIINTPIVLGHDFSGVIDTVGDDVEDFSPGDKVIAQPIGYCGKCYYCMKGRQNLCVKGEWLGFEKNGGFAEYVLASDYNLLRIPDNLSFDEAAIIEPVAVGLRTVKLAKGEIGDVVGVIGQGSIGLIATQLCKLAGFKAIGIDIDREKLELAKRLGADYVLDAKSRGQVLKEVSEITSGLGVQISIEASGTQEGIDMASEITMPGGKIMIVGHRKDLRGPPIMLEKELILQYVELSPLEYNLALKLVSERKVNVKSLITHHVNLDELPKFLEMIANRSIHVVKAIVNP